MIFKIASVIGLIDYIINNKPSLVDEARSWAKDCTWSETEEDPENNFIDEIDPIELLTLINRHYDGGLKEFYKIFG